MKTPFPFSHILQFFVRPAEKKAWNFADDVRHFLARRRISFDCLAARRRAVGAVFLLFAVSAMTACSKAKSTSGLDPSVAYYTCTMHPSVKSQDPNAKCPICSMDLVPVMKKDAQVSPHSHGTAHPTASTSLPEAGSTNEFTVPSERQQQIGVTYATVERRPLTYTIRSVGNIMPDKAREWAFVARVEGYVQKLLVTSPGEKVEKDQPLLMIYSPDLLTAQHEFINILQSRDRAPTAAARQSAEQSIPAARFRLEQWNVTAAQIAELEKSRTVSQVLTLNSPLTGVIEDVPAVLGQKFMSGDRLVEVADLSNVWVWAEFYENELPVLKKGLKATITTAAYQGKKFEGEIALVSPFLEPKKRTVKVRIDIPNPELELRPGMYADIELAINSGEGLTIPVSAVMPTGGRTLVFVDKGEGRLEPRFVDIGKKYGAFYLVNDGLRSGERVVASANFLIDAESKVQGAVNAFAPPAEKPAGDQQAEVTPRPDNNHARH
jgi:Cu(I)/Ag(I) efflux system membrane fusion protein